MKYIDGFVLPIPTKHLETYTAMAQKASAVWREHGALDYRECVGDDLNVEQVLPFPKLVNLAPDESVVFAWITYNSKEERDAINAKVMADPRMSDMCKEAPFDVTRMAYGGFSTIVGD